MVLTSAPRTSVTLIGAGTQGRRLAFMWSSRGNDVHLVDGQEAQLQASIKAIEEFRQSASNRNASWGKIITHSPESLREALQAAWLVVECVPEQIELKTKVISELDALAPRDTIIASNSSSYSCSEILKGLNLRNETRFLSAHSYWPPETPEIEIMGHETTNPSYITLMMEQCKAHGFSPFHVKSPSMGYIYNRIWAAIKREALLAASEGAATPEEIDNIFKGVLKTPKGPFEQMDVVGLDVVLDIEQHYADARGNIPSAPREYLQKFLEEGNLGVKSGRGFYDYGKS
ncbi:related to 3-hydroxyacyl-CoA dehydrogenase [Fusarium fujikuroi]|nr:3-hydroxyacyl-CoA dehydrogenase [Fusarium fujikuroi]SCO11635.1 related to 3-hydroxyacyl-CoA dehydrogenase [Fusarium fujikuroi]SCO14099.1 related to 3-hydroxyacyl-CoA dehydrogenase [Fusarium fujikuroi]SCO14294.1 related to 3-hydroxyacyl-CoA dehydrogenase [Fusarium fujikuroi]SCO40512.1 related to 3-hydroxyacyl-CoA dehydrogenase [Fusarium fujikuroi]